MTDTRTAHSSTTLAWVIYCVHLIASCGLAMFGLLSVFLTDSCGTGDPADEPAVCNGDYLGTVVIGYWIVLLLLLVVVPILIVRAARRGRATWVSALAGLVAAGVATGVFMALVLR